GRSSLPACHSSPVPLLAIRHEIQRSQAHRFDALGMRKLPEPSKGRKRTKRTLVIRRQFLQLSDIDSCGVRTGCALAPLAEGPNRVDEITIGRGIEIARDGFCAFEAATELPKLPKRPDCLPRVPLRHESQGIGAGSIIAEAAAHPSVKHGTEGKLRLLP